MSSPKKLKEIIAIDGPVGVGKSTIGKMLSEKLNFIYIDTGALYRSIGWEVHNRGIDAEDKNSVVKILPKLKVELLKADLGNQVWINGKNATPYLRTQLMSKYASIVSAIPEVREKLLSLQRKLGEKGGVVMDGRDIGTVIFPEARYKFFVDASPEIRARRRYDELDGSMTYEEVLKQTKDRDRLDSTRREAPLSKAADAFYLDTSEYNAQEVLEKMLQVISEKKRLM